MIISRTPYRISFFGGGTDYPGWYRDHGGAVLATTIDKYCYLTCRYLPPFFEHRIRVVYGKLEHCNNADEIEHPAVRETLKYLGITRGVEIHHDGDLPARSGMGSSSSFTVGLLHALYALKGQIRSKEQLANESIYLEQECIRETVGSQDQVLSAYGGFNYISFARDGQISVTPMTLSAQRIDELNDNLILVYTGIVRNASDIAESYVPDISTKNEQLESILGMVEKSKSILSGDGDIGEFGELLHEAWLAKKQLSTRVSTGELDDLYQRGRTSGAIGGKILGAGGGGFMLLFVPPEKQQEVRKSLNQFLTVPFRFESSGSQIIFFDNEIDYSAAEIARSSQSIDKLNSTKGRERSIRQVNQDH